MAGDTARAFAGIVWWPLDRMWWDVRDLAKTLERLIFGHQTELKKLIFCAQIDRLSREVLLSVNRPPAKAASFHIFAVIKLSTLCVEAQDRSPRALKRRATDHAELLSLNKTT